MAAPTATTVISANFKTSASSSLLTPSSTTFVVDDWLELSFGMDPSSGAVSYAHSGTAVLTSWTYVDGVSGSGTSGVRFINGRARVSTSGTVTGVTVTHPAAISRVALGTRISGALGSVTATTFGIAGANTTTVPPYGVTSDALFISSQVNESASGGNFGTISPGTWTLQTAGSATTSGGSANTNVRVDALPYTTLAATSQSYSQSVSNTAGVYLNMATFYGATSPTTTTGAVRHISKRQ